MELVKRQLRVNCHILVNNIVNGIVSDGAFQFCSRLFWSCILIPEKHLKAHIYRNAVRETTASAKKKLEEMTRGYLRSKLIQY